MTKEARDIWKKLLEHRRIFRKKIFPQSGFTLIELMVVVAILGILATIAIPNFQRFQARAKQKEGQILLSTCLHGGQGHPCGVYQLLL